MSVSAVVRYEAAPIRSCIVASLVVMVFLLVDYAEIDDADWPIAAAYASAEGVRQPTIAGASCTRSSFSTAATISFCRTLMWRSTPTHRSRCSPQLNRGCQYDRPRQTGMKFAHTRIAHRNWRHTLGLRPRRAVYRARAGPRCPAPVSAAHAAALRAHPHVRDDGTSYPSDADLLHSWNTDAEGGMRYAPAFWRRGSQPGME